MVAHERGYEILIVDDDYAVREMLQEVMEDAGYSVLSADNGAEALEQLQRLAQLPRLILLDLMMPVMTGWEFHQAQQSDPRLATIPVIVLSARQTLEQDGASMAVAGFLPKPMNVANLLRLVAGYCA